MTHTLVPSRRLAVLPAVAVLGLLGPGLTACASDDAASGPSSAVSTAADGAVYSAADIDFVTGMIPHHAQAVAMVDLAADCDVSPEVRSLMPEIKSAPAPEIRQMQGLLRDWDQEAVKIGDPTEMSGMGGMDHSGMDHSGMDHSGMDGGGMKGMMSPEMFTDLEKASDAAFESMWLRMMVEHHQGAVEQARTEIANGKNPDAVRLARSIERTQTAEMQEMQGLLQG